MARRLDRILVVDVESTCWKSKPPAGMESEIIEIGITIVDPIAGERLERDGIIVKPEKSTVSPFCTQLTTLTQEMVDEGVSFGRACQMLKTDYDAKQRLWASWGDYDRRMFERQCRDRGIGYPFGPTHLNVKNLYALTTDRRHEVGMDQALTDLGLPLEGTHHRGDDDAWNIAAVLTELLNRLRT